MILPVLMYVPLKMFLQSSCISLWEQNPERDLCYFKKRNKFIVAVMLHWVVGEDISPAIGSHHPVPRFAKWRQDERSLLLECLSSQVPLQVQEPWNAVVISLSSTAKNQIKKPFPVTFETSCLFFVHARAYLQQKHALINSSLISKDSDVSKATQAEQGFEAVSLGSFVC